MTRRDTGALGVMGGTFDPIHCGHLVTAEGARADYGLEKVVFVPAGRPPHKPGAKLSPAEDRYLMTLLATLSNPCFEVSRVDIDRRGPSFTVDTVRELSRLHQPRGQIYFITGADAILEILGWKNPETLFEMCDFIAATRPGFPLGTIEAALGDLYQRRGHQIHLLETPGIAVSSTEIRRRVREGMPIRYLVPEPVEGYIRKRKLYLEG